MDYSKYITALNERLLYLVEIDKPTEDQVKEIFGLIQLRDTAKAERDAMHTSDSI